MLNLQTVLPQQTLPPVTLPVSESVNIPSNHSASPPPQTVGPQPANTAEASLSAPLKGDLKTELGRKHNLRSLGQKLSDMAARLGGNATAQAISMALKTTPMDIHPDSGYPAGPGGAVAVATYIEFLGLPLPDRQVGLVGLATAVFNRAQEHPLGNFGGALSWPQPLNISEQRTLLSAAGQYASTHPNPPQMGASLGVLEYLNSNQPLSSEASNDPAKALEHILSSPRAQAQGLAVQTRLNGIATQTSINDYVLATLHLALDPESITSPHRNKVAGFDLAQQAHWGQPLSVVREGLIRHLIERGKTTPEMAKVGAYLLLARKAPALLIKDVPASVTYGSPAWVNLTIAAATIEARTPGKVANMSFAQVMVGAENAALQDPAITEQAQKAALIDWGVVKNVVTHKSDDNYSHDEIEKARTEFNLQLSQRMAHSHDAETEMPSREEIARARIKQRFGENVPLEEKLLKVKQTKQPSIEPIYDPYRAPAGLFSLLDIAMSGLHGYKWETSDLRILDATNGKSLQFDVTAEFNTQLSQAIAARKKGVGAVIKHLVAELPLADRQNFEYGKLEFYQNHTYRQSLYVTGKTREHKNDVLLVKATGANGARVYQIDLKKGAITRVNPNVLTHERERAASLVYPIEPFTPTSVSESNFYRNEPAGSVLPIPASFSSARTQAIADAFVEHLEIDSQEVIQQARGSSSYDQQKETEWQLTNFFLDLIPLRSAIVNFSNGNYVEGAADLAMDVFGFVTAGLGTAAKVAKVGVTAVSTAAKTLRATRIIGAGIISAFNPLSGADDVVRGIGNGAKFLIDKGTRGVNMLRGASGSYDLLKAASKSNGLVATGTYKTAEQTLECAAVFEEGKWYGYDPVRNTPYGPPMKDFTPNVVALEGEIRAFTDSWLGKMIGSIVAPAANNPEFRKDFISALAKAKAEDMAAYIRGQNTGKPEAIFGYSTALSIDDVKRLAVAERRTPAELGSLVKRIDELEALPDRFKTAEETAKIVDPDAYKAGYRNGKPEGIAGFSDSLTSNQLAELVVVSGRPAEEIGRLIRYMQNRRIHVSLENFKVFKEEILTAGGKVAPLPQGFYLSQVSLLSEGECAALSNVMAAATRHGKQDIFIENLYAAMVPPLDAAEIAALRTWDPAKAAIEQARSTKVARFRDQLNQLQEILGNKFHLGMQSRQVPFTTIISELANASASRTLLINAQGHGFTAGVVVSNGKKEWFYFDPNFGKATFATKEAMSAALESTLSTGRTKNLLLHFGNNPSVPEYKISVFNEADLNAVTSTLKSQVPDLFMRAL